MFYYFSVADINYKEQNEHLLCWEYPCWTPGFRLICYAGQASIWLWYCTHWTCWKWQAASSRSVLLIRMRISNWVQINIEMLNNFFFLVNLIIPSIPCSQLNCLVNCLWKIKTCLQNKTCHLNKDLPSRVKTCHEDLIIIKTCHNKDLS